MSTDTRQPRQPAESEDTSAFAQHAQQDAALGTAPDDETSESHGMSFTGRITVFVVFPMVVGVLGLYIAYLRTISNPEKKIDFDNDFVFPFIVALAFVMVVGFQTKGFTQSKVTPLVQWPKVRRKKRIIRKRVIVDDDGNEISQEAKKDD